MVLLKLYELSIQIEHTSVVVQFRPVAASSTRKYVLLVVGFNAVAVAIVAAGIRNYAGFLIPFIILCSAWSSYRQLRLREELCLTRHALTVASYSGDRLRRRMICKPAFVTNVRFNGGGEDTSSCIRLDMEMRITHFAEGIDYEDACKVLAAIADSGLFPNPAQVRFS